MELTESDAGAEHTVDVGQQLVVRLQENRTTGFRWHLSLPEDGVALDEDSFDVDASGRPGAGGVRTFRLHATKPGKHRLGASLQRSWGSADAAQPALDFHLTAR